MIADNQSLNHLIHHLRDIGRKDDNCFEGCMEVHRETRLHLSNKLRAGPFCVYTGENRIAGPFIVHSSPCHD